MYVHKTVTRCILRNTITWSLEEQFKEKQLGKRRNKFELIDNLYNIQNVTKH